MILKHTELISASLLENKQVRLQEETNGRKNKITIMINEYLFLSLYSNFHINAEFTNMKIGICYILGLFNLNVKVEL